MYEPIKLPVIVVNDLLGIVSALYAKRVKFTENGITFDLHYRGFTVTYNPDLAECYTIRSGSFEATTDNVLSIAEIVQEYIETSKF